MTDPQTHNAAIEAAAKAIEPHPNADVKTGGVLAVAQKAILALRLPEDSQPVPAEGALDPGGYILTISGTAITLIFDDHKTAVDAFDRLERGDCSALTTSGPSVAECAREPDYYYDPEEWEYTCDKTCVEELAQSAIDYRPGRPARISTLFKGPDKWVAEVPVSTDEDGNADDWQVCWFDTEEDALRALASDKGAV